MSAQGRRQYPCEYDRKRESTAASSLAGLWSASKHVARPPSWRSLRDRDQTTTVRTTPAVACAPGESHQVEQPADARPGTQARPCPNDDCDASHPTSQSPPIRPRRSLSGRPAPLPLICTVVRVKASFQRLACSVCARPYLGRRSPACGARDVMVDRSSRGGDCSRSVFVRVANDGGVRGSCGSWLQAFDISERGDEGAGVRPRARLPLGPVRGEGGSCVGRSCVRSSATLECE